MSPTDVSGMVICTGLSVSMLLPFTVTPGLTGFVKFTPAPEKTSYQA